MGRSVLLLSGYGAGEKQLPGLEEALKGRCAVHRLAAGADTAGVREAYAFLTRGGGGAVVAGVGAGCVQALMLAQAFPVEALMCLLPGADGRRGRSRDRLVAMGNLFAVVAPTLVVEAPGQRLGRRIYEGSGARDKRLAPWEGAGAAIQTILEHLRRTDVTDSLANQHNFGVI